MLLATLVGEKIPCFNRYHYFYSVLSAGLLLVCSGSVVAWPSPNIHRLRSGETPVQDGYEDVTGVGYIFFIGCVPGFLLTWLFLTYVGRRTSLLGAALLYATSWFVMGQATTLSWVYGARLIQGMAQTLALVIAPVYIVEISPVSLREVAGFSMQFFFNLGLLLQYSIGPFVSFTLLIYINLLLTLIIFAVFLLLAFESPYFLLKHSKRFKAEQVLRHLRNHVQPPNEDGIQKEFQVIQNMLEENNACNTWKQIKLLLFDKGMRKALLITLGLTYLFVFSGLSQLLMFAESIFRISQVSISPSLSCILIGLVKIIGGFTLPFLVKPFGIKRIAICSTSLAAIAMFFLGLFFFLKNENYNMEPFFWTPLCLLLLYFLLTSVGLSFLLMHVRAEIFPPQMKPTGILIQEVVNIISLEICSLFFTQLLSPDAIFIPIWFFSASMGVSVVFMAFALPSSHTMTLYDIQVWLNK